MSHQCRRCGASCQGLRVVVDPNERAQLELAAKRLGVARPFSGPHLRQNWGTCVFYDQGCRLHAEIGPQAKPLTCRRFPEVAGIDPACFHPGEHGSQDLWDGWDDISFGLDVRERLRTLPLQAVLKPARLGPLVVAALEGLDRVEPLPPTEWRARLDWRARAAVSYLQHHQDVPRLLIGGAQLLQGRDRPHSYAAWIRLLRTLPHLSA